ncbi:MAG: hypothetical protein JSS29_13185 [Proteobacteria bacterium]|nr:hypothetical protein [Pseudomonadota bacterium]
MGFLLIKILLLLVLAAGSGAFVARWWFRRHYEDVTLEYARAREEWQAWRHSFEERLAARPEVDLDPITDQIASVQAAVTELPPPERVNLGPLEERLEVLGERIDGIRIPAPPDLGSIDARLTAIEHALFPLQSRLDELTGAVRGLHPRDAAPAVPESAPAAALEHDEEPPAAITVEAHAGEVEDSEGLDDSPDEELDDDMVRRGSRNLLKQPALGKPDDLSRIKGVAKVMERTLHNIGVFYFWQIAEWTPEDVRQVEDQIEGFHRRIEDDDWVGQAVELAQQPSAIPRPKGH